MNKLFLNKEGFVCYRFPYNFICENEDTQFIEVDDDMFNNTLSVESGYIWAYIDNQLKVIPYDLELIEELKKEV